jgi:hypothetical protein
VASEQTNPIRYGTAALPEVLTSAAAAAGAPFANTLALPPNPTVLVLVLDGLGWMSLQANADVAPFLTGLAGRPLTAGFPATTATSLASIGTGLPPAGHGIVGYTTLLPDTPGLTEPINWLRWRGAASGRDLVDSVPPEQIQPLPTVFEQVAGHGIGTRIIAAGEYRSSGLTRAVLRGASYRAISTLADAVATIADSARDASPQLLYAYLGDQDLIGHKYGPSSDPWRMQLTIIDRVLQMLADRLPAAVTMVVTADHGMVDVPDAARIDYDAEPVLRRDVRAIAGEGRARFLHILDGRAGDVATRWADRLGDGVGVLPTEEAIAAGWFGGQPDARIRPRLGDVVAVSRNHTTVVRRRAERYLATMRGQHGALTDEELLVPLLIHTT